MEKKKPANAVSEETAADAEVKEDAPVKDKDPKETKETKKDKKSADKKDDRIKELEAQLNDAVSAAQRLQAEFDNYRKRNARLRQDSIEEGTEAAVKAMLDTLDSFERAMESKSSDDQDPFYQGIALVYKQMRDALAKLGLSEIDTQGQFDPMFHDAVMQDDSGEHESGTVTCVLQKGYKLGEKVIRHAMVKVAL